MPGSAGKDRRRPRVKLRPRPAVLFPVLVLAVGLAGCSIDYKGAAEEPSPEGIPDTVATGLLHRVHKDGRLSLELEAARAETFNSKSTTILTDAHFVEFDDKGGAATEGTARKVLFHSDTEDADISGGVHVHSAAEKGDIRADTLHWENKPKRLTAPPGEQVRIIKDDGTTLVGSGFSGDFLSRTVTFTGTVQGTYVWKETK
jgi:LPS export ABC transporter protein LptC